MEGSSSQHYMLQEFDHDLFLQSFCHPGKYPSLYEELALFPLGHAIQNIHLEINILELNDSCVTALEKWLKKEENAVDCAGGAQFIPELGISRLDLLAKEEILRGKVKSIKKYDLSPTEASAPPTEDFLTCIYMLEFVCVDEESFLRNLKAIGSKIKIGGFLVACGAFNHQFLTIGDKKFKTFPYDEILLRRCMKNAGFNIIIMEMRNSKRDSEITQYDQLWCMAAIREREV